MTPALRSLAEFDGWIFSSTGNTAQRGKNGSVRRLTDLHYDRWTWIMPVYFKLCEKFAGDLRLKNIQSAILLGDIEVVGELCGRMVEEMKEK
jgi:hypothetical protein